MRSKGRSSPSGTSTYSGSSINSSIPSLSRYSTINSVDSTFFRRYTEMTDAEIEPLFQKFLENMNIKGEKAEEMKKMPIQKKQQILEQNQKRDNAVPPNQQPQYFAKSIINAFQHQNGDEIQDVIKSLKISLNNFSVYWIEEFCQIGGVGLLCKMGSKLISLYQNDALNSENKVSHSSEAMHQKSFGLFLDITLNIINCIRSIANTWPGIRCCMKKHSNVAYTLLEILQVLEHESYNFNKKYMSAFESLNCGIFRLLSSIVFFDNSTVKDEPLEQSGFEMITKDMIKFTQSHKTEPFLIIIELMKFTGRECCIQGLTLINVLLSRIPKEVDGGWMMRIKYRMKLYSCGFSKLLPILQQYSMTDDKMSNCLDKFLQERDTDHGELCSKLDIASQNYETIEDTITAIIGYYKNSSYSGVLNSVLHHFLFVPDDNHCRKSYLVLLDGIMSELFNDFSPFDSNWFEKIDKSFFNNVLNTLDEKYGDSNEFITKKLKQITAEKEEAEIMQSEYYKKIEEYKRECTSLREYIKDPTKPLPPETKCNLQPPKEIFESKVPSSNIPLPPPGPPPLLINKSSSGPPLPPPPPPSLNSKVKSGGPPPPPLPPSNGPSGFPSLSNKGKVAPNLMYGNTAQKLPEFLKEKKKYSTKKALKKVQIQNAIIKPTNINKESFWAQTSEDNWGKENILQCLNENFESNVKKNTNNELMNGDGSTLKRKTKLAKVITDDKVLQRVSIFYGSSKRTAQKWFEIITSIDDKELNGDILIELKAALPPPEIMKELKEIPEKEYNSMPAGESFAAILSKIPALPLRLELLAFRANFKSVTDELKGQVSTITDCLDNIYKSKGFKAWLELVLFAVNYMGQSNKNFVTVFAYKMDALSKLADTKSTLQNETLLHSLIRIFEGSHYGNLVHFPRDDFIHLATASRISYEEMMRNIQIFKHNVKKLSNCLSNYQTFNGGKDKFKEIMPSFLDKASAAENILDKMVLKMESKWKKVVDFFSYDCKTYPMSEFFEDLLKFKGLYEQAYSEIKEKEASNRVGQEKKKVISSNTSVRETLKAPNVMEEKCFVLKTNQKSVGLMDEIENHLNNMASYKVVRSPRRPRERHLATNKGPLSEENTRERAYKNYKQVNKTVNRDGDVVARRLAGEALKKFKELSDDRDQSSTTPINPINENVDPVINAKTLLSRLNEL